MENKEYTSATIRKDLKRKLKDIAKARGKLLYALLDDIVNKFIEKEGKK